MVDFHVHTGYSSDSDATMAKYIQVAKEKGVKWLCFTDHVDLNPGDYGFNYYSEENFFDEFELYKNDSQINVCSGIEFGEPHIYSDWLQAFAGMPYDFIIGSVHWVGDLFPSHKIRQKYSVREFFSMYWDEVLKTVQTGGFDCLGHVDFPKRYYGEIYYNEFLMKEIFKNLVDKDMVLEINTSSLRKGYHETMPGDELLQIYCDVGGKYVTIGSDAHSEDDLATDYDVAKELADKNGFQIAVYKERKRIIL